MMDDLVFVHDATPEPFIPDIGEAAPYPLEALGALRDVVLAVHDLTQAPLAIAAQSALAAASLAVQGHANVVSLAGPSPASLFLLTIAESGERKSTCDRLLMRAFDAKLQDDHIVFRSEMKLYSAIHLAWTEEQKVLSRPKKNETEMGKITREADLRAHAGREPVAPLRPERLTSDTTIEGLVKYLTIGQPSIGLFNDEGGTFLGGHSMSSENRLRTLSGLSSLWDGSATTRTRAGDGTETIRNRRLACHLMVQPVIATPLLADALAAQQGFLPRFLIVSPASRIGKRIGHTPRPESEGAVALFAEQLGALLARDMPTVDGTRQELAPRLLPLSEAATAELRRHYEEVEAAQAPFCEFSEVRAFASKSAEQAARIAGVLTLFGDIDAQEVSAETMKQATTLALYYLREAVRLFGASAISEEARQVDLLLRWLQHRDEGDFIIADIVQYGPNTLRDTKRAKALVGTLCSHGAVVALPQMSVVGGKARKEAYRVVR